MATNIRGLAHHTSNRPHDHTSLISGSQSNCCNSDPPPIATSKTGTIAVFRLGLFFEDIHFLSHETVWQRLPACDGLTTRPSSRHRSRTPQRSDCLCQTALATFSQTATRQATGTETPAPAGVSK